MDNDELEVVNTILNPSRIQVRNLVAQALDDSGGDPAQVFADMIMATAQIAAMGDIEITGIEEMFQTAMPNAKIAGDYVLAALGEQLNDG